MERECRNGLCGCFEHDDHFSSIYPNFPDLVAHAPNDRAGESPEGGSTEAAGEVGRLWRFLSSVT